MLAADLAIANSRLIWTIPQSDFEAPAEVARLIEAAESARPTRGPFRIYRMTGWYPEHFSRTRSENRFREWVAWERGTLQPYYALPLNLEYCAAIGHLELDEYIAFFRPRALPLPSAMAGVLGVPAGEQVVYYPRRSYDLWGARYFLLPAAHDWQSTARGFAAFLDNTELVYPDREMLDETGNSQGRESWRARNDWQLRRNRAAYPRAWIVHSARLRQPIRGLEERASLMRTITYMNDPIWQQSDRSVFHLGHAALVETDRPQDLSWCLSEAGVGPNELVTVSSYEPQRVKLRAHLDQPGLVILADTYYPGWRLTIDGKAAPIYRANRLMRAAAVREGDHTLVYSYEPDSFRLGAILTAMGLIVASALAWGSGRTPHRLRQLDPAGERRDWITE